MANAATLRVPANLKQLAVVRHFVEQAAGELGAQPDTAADMIQAVDEAVTNIVVHGYGSVPGSIEVEVSRDGELLLVHLRDWAPLFDPTTVPPPDLTLPLFERQHGGLGVYFMRQFTDELSYRVLPGGGNELTLARRMYATA